MELSARLRWQFAVRLHLAHSVASSPAAITPAQEDCYTGEEPSKDLIASITPCQSSADRAVTA